MTMVNAIAVTIPKKLYLQENSKDIIKESIEQGLKEETKKLQKGGENMMMRTGEIKYRHKQLI